jgi:hypothetical protein
VCLTEAEHLYLEGARERNAYSWVVWTRLLYSSEHLYAFFHLADRG